jgi:hypothetical protein
VEWGGGRGEKGRCVMLTPWKLRWRKAPAHHIPGYVNIERKYNKVTMLLTWSSSHPNTPSRGLPPSWFMERRGHPPARPKTYKGLTEMFKLLYSTYPDDNLTRYIVLQSLVTNERIIEVASLRRDCIQQDMLQKQKEYHGMQIVCHFLKAKANAKTT